MAAWLKLLSAIGLQISELSSSLNRSAQYLAEVGIFLVPQPEATKAASWTNRLSPELRACPATIYEKLVGCMPTID